MSSAQKPIIVCLTHADDDHIAHVLPHLESEMLVIHGLPSKETDHLTYEFLNGNLQVLQDGKPLPPVKSVWYRKPKIYQEYLHVWQGYGKYAWSALKNNFDFLFPILGDAFWISDESAIRKSSSKPWQLLKAAALGFRVPDTLTTSDSQAAKSFFEAQGDIIVKSPSVWGFRMRLTCSSFLPHWYQKVAR